MREKILRRLRDSQNVADSFWALCDFALLDEDTPGWFALKSGEPFRVIARDGAGGRFCLYRPAGKRSKALLYVSSEGQAGTIAQSLAEGVQMLVALPHWQDCLKFSGGGDLRKMQEAQAWLEADLRRRQPDIGAVRQALYQTFELAAPPSPLESLRRAIAEGTAVVVATRDGSEFESLWGTPRSSPQVEEPGRA
jgi:hypothetical protein